MLNEVSSRDSTIVFNEINNSDFEKVVLYTGFNEKGKVIGKYDKYRKIFVTYRRETQLLRMLDAFGFNYYFITNYDIKLIRIRYCKKNYFTSKEYLLRNGEVMKFDGYDRQIFLPVDNFYTSIKAFEKNNRKKTIVEIMEV